MPTRLSFGLKNIADWGLGLLIKTTPHYVVTRSSKATKTQWNTTTWVNDRRRLLLIASQLAYIYIFLFQGFNTGCII